MSGNRRDDIIEAAGMGTATRELGGVIGIALVATLFQLGSHITSPTVFAEHLVPAIWLSAASYDARGFGQFSDAMASNRYFQVTGRLNK